MPKQSHHASLARRLGLAVTATTATLLIAGSLNGTIASASAPITTATATTATAGSSTWAYDPVTGKKVTVS